MTSGISITRWRDKAIKPDAYDDVAGLVATARKARGRIVEFDWVFKRDDLLRLRDAVFDWGTPVVGRYKCFDARVLAAVNDALGEINTLKVLNEPRNSEGTDCQASCVADGDLFRLRGHAPFDVVYGYGSAGVGRDPRVSEILGPAAMATLANAVGMLGWDLHLLQVERLRPVQNALFGNALDYGILAGQRSSEPAVDVHIHFDGPFSVTDGTGSRCLFADAIAKRSGVYLWTITVNGEERPWYVGQTLRGFAERMGEHLAGFLSGRYTTYDAVALSRGENRLADGAVFPRWPDTLPSFLQNHEKLAPNIASVIRMINFHAALVDGDRHLHDRIEGAIGRYYHADPALRGFFFPGGLRVPAAIPFDRALRLVLSSEMPIVGLPQYLEA